MVAILQYAGKQQARVLTVYLVGSGFCGEDLYLLLWGPHRLCGGACRAGREGNDVSFEYLFLYASFLAYPKRNRPPVFWCLPYHETTLTQKVTDEWMC